MLSATRHQANFVALLHGTVYYANQYDDTLVRVIPRVKDQCFQGRIGGALRRWNFSDYRLEDTLDAKPCFCAANNRIACIQTDNLLNLGTNSLRLSAGQVDFIQDRKDFEVLIDGQINIRQSLSFDPL